MKTQGPVGPALQSELSTVLFFNEDFKEKKAQQSQYLHP